MTTNPTPAAPPAGPDVLALLAAYDRAGAAFRLAFRTQTAAVVDAAERGRDDARDVLESAIAALVTHQTATERVVAAAEEVVDVQEWVTDGGDDGALVFDAAGYELGAAVAALRAMRDGGGS